MPLDLPEPIETIARLGLGAADELLDALVAGLNTLRDGLAALDARVEELESKIA